MNSAVRFAGVVMAALLCGVDSGVANLLPVTVVFPEAAPELTRLSAPPSWLPDGKGDDGYVSIAASILPPGPCTSLGSPGLFGIASEKQQIVVSIRTAGLNSTFNEVEVPIATFDGSANPTTCWGLTQIPVQVVNLARLEKFSVVNPGVIGLLVKVYSTSEVNLNLLPTAQAVADIAAVFATGPAAVNVKAVTTMLAKPLFSSLEGRLNKAASSAVQGESKPGKNYTWTDFRGGIASLKIPVYSGKTKGWPELPSEAIDRLRRENQAATPTKLFDIVLDFAYTKTIVDPSVAGTTDVPRGPVLSSTRVLNLPPKTPANFLQLLNSSSPSLQQVFAAAQTTDTWSSACARSNQLLEGIGLNRLDRLIVTKAFIDDARGSTAWYYIPANRNACFDKADLDEFVLRMWGQTESFRWDGSQDGSGTAYEGWRDSVLPYVDAFSSALRLEYHRESALARLNGGKDIEFTYVEWPPIDQPAETDSPGMAFFAKYPNLWRLASKRIGEASCYAYFQDVNLNGDAPGVHMVVVDEAGERWRLFFNVNAKSNSPIVRVEARRLDNGWKNAFARDVNDSTCGALLR